MSAPERVDLPAGRLEAEHDAVVTGTVTTETGRFVVSARSNHFVTDSRLAGREAVHAGELLLAALTSCAMANFEHNAEQDGLPVDGIVARAAHTRGTVDPTRYDRTVLEIEVSGVEYEDAFALGRKFVAACPIYNTIRRGSGIELTINGRTFTE
ncbi:OsmC family protein [Rhodococcus sp. Z13]|uniref:OsmC family protein n=1 Tax=Rhodococcus sacchari TaxID=2962047 RepID=A0ACD4DG42_9NOCA|nr:OsmC family protein [Rhodococcus sp. Z13]UYP18910.1 OsmC family protein [Rhodococcus sp. Z13]